MSTVLVLVSALLQAAPVTAPAANPDAQICRKVPAPTGSRVTAKRECRTAAEWAVVDAENKRDIDQMRRRTARQNY